MAILERMSVEFWVVAKAIERLAPHPFPRSRRSLCGLEEYDLRGSSPAGDWSQRWDAKFSNQMASPAHILSSNEFSIKTTQLKTLKIFEPNSQAKMAPDSHARSSGSDRQVVRSSHVS